MFQKIVMVIMFAMILTLWYRQERTADYLRTQARVSAESTKAQASAKAVKEFLASDEKPLPLKIDTWEMNEKTKQYELVSTSPANGGTLTLREVGKIDPGKTREYFTKDSQYQLCEICHRSLKGEPMFRIDLADQGDLVHDYCNICYGKAMKWMMDQYAKSVA